MRWDYDRGGFVHVAPGLEVVAAYDNDFVDGRLETRTSNTKLSLKSPSSKNDDDASPDHVRERALSWFQYLPIFANIWKDLL